MAKKNTVAPLRYPIKRSFKMTDETFIELTDIAIANNTKFGTLVRVIVEEWLAEKRGKENNVHTEDRS
jgi:hypothetical protein